MTRVPRFWNDTTGFVISAELVLIATVLVMGLLVGIVTIRDQVIQELADVADAFSEVEQSFSFSGMTGHASSTAGTVFGDSRDYCELFIGGSDQIPGGLGNFGPQCLQMLIAPSAEGP